MMNFKKNIKTGLIYLLLIACKANNNNPTSYKKVSNMKENNVFKVTNEDGTSYEVQRILRAELDSLLEQSQLIIEDSLSKKYGYRIFLMKDSRVIIEQADNYAIYPSKELLIKQLEKVKGPVVREILYNKNPYGVNFPNHTKELIDSFIKSYHIREVGKKELLNEVDNLIATNRDDDFFQKNYLVLIALVGECIIEERGGEWKMDLGADGVTWTPYISFGSKKLYFIHYLRDDFYNEEIDEPLFNSYEDILAIVDSNIKS